MKLKHLIIVINAKYDFMIITSRIRLYLYVSLAGWNLCHLWFGLLFIIARMAFFLPFSYHNTNTIPQKVALFNFAFVASFGLSFQSNLSVPQIWIVISLTLRLSSGSAMSTADKICVRFFISSQITLQQENSWIPWRNNQRRDKYFSVLIYVNVFKIWS